MNVESNVLIMTIQQDGTRMLAIESKDSVSVCTK